MQERVQTNFLITILKNHLDNNSKVFNLPKDSAKIKLSIQLKPLILMRNDFTVNTVLQNALIVQEYFGIVQKERGLLHVI